MTERSTCRHCGKPIILAPFFVDGRLPNPSIWSHPSGGTTCGTKPKDWRRPDWPHAAPSLDPAVAEGPGEMVLESALLQAEAHAEALRELSGSLRSGGHAYAYAAAYTAWERADDLVKQLREDLLARDVDDAARPEGSST